METFRKERVKHRNMYVIILSLLLSHTIGLIIACLNLSWANYIENQDPEGQTFTYVCHVVTDNNIIDTYFYLIDKFFTLQFWQIPVIQIFWISKVKQPRLDTNDEITYRPSTE